jgi:hypothetical protein
MSVEISKEQVSPHIDSGVMRSQVETPEKVIRKLNG